MIFILAFLESHEIWEGLLQLLGNPEWLQDPLNVFIVACWLISTLVAKGLVESGSMVFLGKRTRLSWFWALVLGWLMLMFFFLRKSDD